MRTKKPAVYGIVAPPPRLTRGALIAVLTRLAVPFLCVLMLLDAALWVIMRFVFDSCYGVLCWL